MWIWLSKRGEGGQDWFLQVCLFDMSECLRRPEAFNDVLASLPTTMEAAFGRLHNNGAGASGYRPIVVDSMVMDGEAKTLLDVLGSRKTFRNIKRQSFKKQSCHPLPPSLAPDVHTD